MLYHQSVHNNLKTKREREHISNLINFSIFQFFWRKRIRHSFPHFLFKNKLSYYEKGTEWKTFFFVFFQGFKTHFLVLTRVKFSSPNHVMQFIDTKNFFFHSQHVYLLYYQPAKEILEQRCLFTCPKFGYFRKKYGPT